MEMFISSPVIASLATWIFCFGIPCKSASDQQRLEHLEMPCILARQEMPRVTVANAPLCLHSSLRARGDELW